MTIRSLAGTAALLFLLSTACDESRKTCNVPGPIGAWGEHTSDQLPDGACNSADDCRLTTRDTCPNGSPGPSQTWSCSCTQAAWACVVVETTKSICLPAADAGTDQSVD